MTDDRTFDRMHDAIQYLSQDSGRCFSRFGQYSDECAPVAYVLSLIHAVHGSGDPIDTDSLDGSMGMVVNDHPEVETTINDMGTTLGWRGQGGWMLDEDDDLIPVIPDDYLNAAFRQYIETLLWSDTYTEDDDSDPIPLDDLFTADDLPATAVVELRDEFVAFLTGSWDDLFDMDPEQAGHDFALTRNGHGTGYWDHGLDAQGDRLTQACRPHGELSLDQYLPAPDPTVLADIRS